MNLKPTTKKILLNARLNRRRIGGGRRTKIAAVYAIRLKDQPREVRRANYLGTVMVPMSEEPF